MEFGAALPDSEQRCFDIYFTLWNSEAIRNIKCLSNQAFLAYGHLCDLAK